MNAVAEEGKKDASEASNESSMSKTEQANQVVRNYAIGSIVPSLVPIPAVDLVAVTGIQLKMVHSLAKIYDVPFKDELVRSSISSLIGSTVALSASRVASSAVKVIPGVGSILGTLTMPTINGATTFALGKVFIQHFESGGTFLTFDPEKVRDYFAHQLDEGKKMVAEATASGEVDEAAEKAKEDSGSGRKKSDSSSKNK
ncbi:DUF697 domain-containing protein [Thalassomonas sp. RHCl1]|uniref:YcjF family protein n=1 Tax=Thalassomonas sp. RHCl1 TaxID=2995320 RepID=UPI00248AA15C|nr:DUF697 domain-containing protein [Thalassomonas sp. RHCl1]